MNCPKCHAPVSNGQKFCPQCGASLPEIGPTSRKSFGIKLIVGLILAALLIAGLSRYGEENPTHVVREQVDAIQNNKLTQAYYDYTAKEFQATTSLDDFKKFVKSFPLLLKHISEEFENLEDQNDVKNVKGLLKGEDGGSLTLHFQLLPEDNTFKILNIKAIPSSNAVTPELSEIHQDIFKPIEKQINYLNVGDFHKAYSEGTSPEFKKVSSYDQFKEFLNQFPVLTSFINHELLDVNVSGNEANVKVKFSSPEFQSIIDYSMIKEGNQWLINGIQMSSQENALHTVPGFNSEELLKPLHAEMKSLKEKDFKKAYEGYTSKAFQKATSFEDFENFMKNYDIFSDNKIADFYKLTFNNNVGLYTAHLTSNNGQSKEVEFALIKEDGYWKILQIQILDPVSK